MDGLGPFPKLHLTTAVHRDFPGRVLTLREELGAQCRGRVYRIADERWSEVFRYLEDRESGGYCACRLDLDVGGANNEGLGLDSVT